MASLAYIEIIYFDIAVKTSPVIIHAKSILKQRQGWINIGFLLFQYFLRKYTGLGDISFISFEMNIIIE